MSDASHRAVFLSYASTDEDAARRICEALRSAGVEVWFDADGGLEHGDEWDAKIRRQIKECVLFIPVISVATQARHEGYFRIEWELAAQRAMGIASGVPFILPVVVDNTLEPDALVPDSFRLVQWTRLRGGEVPAEVRERLLNLWSQRTGVTSAEAVKHGQETPILYSTPPSAADSGNPGRQLGGRRFRAATAVAGLAVVLAAGGFFWSRRLVPLPAEQPKTGTPGTMSGARALAAKGEELFRKLATERGDFELAEDFYRQALTADAFDGEIWAGYSLLCAAFVYRGFDRSTERKEQVRTTAERATRLSPNSPDSRLAMASYKWQQQINLDEVEETLRDLRRLRPGDHTLLRFLSLVLRSTGKFEESMALLDEAAAAPGGDPLALTNKAGALWRVGREEEAAQAIDASLAQQPLNSALLMKVYFDLSVYGNCDAALSDYQALPAAVTLTDRGLYYGTLVYLWNRQPSKALQLLQAVPRDYLDDNAYDGPRSFLIGWAQQMKNNREAATVEWRTALEIVEQRFAKMPNARELFMWRAKLNALLGQTSEAERALRTYEQMVGYSFSPTRQMSPDLMDVYLALGRKQEVLARLRVTVGQAANGTRARRVLRYNPRLDSLRDNADFQALLIEPKPAASGAREVSEEEFWARVEADAEQKRHENAPPPP